MVTQGSAGVAPDEFEAPTLAAQYRGGVPPGNREGWSILLALTLAVAIASATLQWGFAGKRTAFDEAALGTENTSTHGLPGESVHCKDLTNAAGCIRRAQAHGGKTLLWLGNSQLHAINQMKPHDKSAPRILQEMLSQRGLEAIAFSQPNANLQEHYVLFEYLRARTQIHGLIIPVVFDDMREDNVRASLRDALDDQRVRAALSKTVSGRSILIRHEDDGSAGDDSAALAATVQEKSESAANRWLDEHSDLWDARAEFRGQLFLRLYHLRNTVFGINPQTKRKMIPGRYQSNMAALEAMLRSAHEASITTLVYIPPLRQDVEPPYVRREYDQFIREVQKLAGQHGAEFHNIEGIVPAKFWGTNGSTRMGGGRELDFMHFQGPGHELLARHIASLVSARMETGSR